MNSDVFYFVEYILFNMNFNQDNNKEGTYRERGPSYNSDASEFQSPYFISIQREKKNILISNDIRISINTILREFYYYNEHNVDSIVRFVNYFNSILNKYSNT